ncbi:MAG TPA: SDR family NAD(P)-dependent oxidoreductase [Acidimicrobiales bacterium]
MAQQKARVDLAGALAVVTGAGSGIGRATALALAGEGAHVVCADLVVDQAEKTAGACAELGQPSWAEACDVASFDEVEALARRVFDEHGVPDVVVNNAGVGMSGRLEAMTIDDWRWIRSINLDGVVHGCRVFGPPMLRRGSGHVVNVSSGLGYMTSADEPAYVTTKAAVLALSRCLQADWGRQGVGVSAICPGVINTAIISRTRFAGDDGEERRKMAQRVFRRGHKPETVGAAIVEAIRRNRAVVPVGWEARIGWGLHRVMPVAMEQFFARQGGFR